MLTGMRQILYLLKKLNQIFSINQRGISYSRPSLRMDMAAVPVAVTRSVSTGVVFLEYCVTF